MRETVWPNGSDGTAPHLSLATATVLRSSSALVRHLRLFGEANPCQETTLKRFFSRVNSKFWRYVAISDLPHGNGPFVHFDIQNQTGERRAQLSATSLSNRTEPSRLLAGGSHLVTRMRDSCD